MLPIEREALTQPDRVRARLPALIAQATEAGDQRTLALLHLAEANACRVVADWKCQREAGARAQSAAREVDDPVLEVRGLIASARARIALGDFHAGERQLGAAELILAEQATPDLSADVLLGYSSLSHRLGKHAVAADYARRGLAILGADGERGMRVRLLRNLARATASMGDMQASERALSEAAVIVDAATDPKLAAELAIEGARIAQRRGDLAAQRDAVDVVMRHATELRNSQLEGLGWELDGIADVQSGDRVGARAAFATAIDRFRRLGQARDEHRVIASMIGTAPEPALLAALAERYISLNAEVVEADRAEAAHGFEERLQYAQQELDLVRLQSEAAITESERASLELRLSYNRLLMLLAGALVLALITLVLSERTGKRRLARALAMRHQALMQTSHELRNALAAVSSVAEQLAEQPLPGKAPDLVRTIRKAADHILALAQDLLDRGRIEAGRMTLTLEPVRLDALLDQLRALHAPLAREKGLRLVVNADVKALPALMLDGTRVLQVLVNLVGNAIKFTDAGEVRVSVVAEPLDAGRWRVAFDVQDDGPGIPGSDVERLFEPFVQTLEGRRHAGGVGLGLAISHDLVALMGGRLRAESGRLRGARLHFDIIVAAADETANAARVVSILRAELPTEEDGLSPLRVVAVDDDPVVLMLYEGLFARFGIVPSLHARLDDALAAHRSDMIDLLVVDFELDGRSSVEGIQRGFAHEPDRPRIAVVSGHPAPDELPSCVDEWLQKPVSAMRLAMLVDAARRSAEARRRARQVAA